MGSVNCMSRRSIKDQAPPPPPRAVLFNANNPPANNNPKSHLAHERELEQPLDNQPPEDMNAAPPPRQRARQMNDDPPGVINLISDDEESDFELEDEADLYGASPAPIPNPELNARPPAPYGPPNPAPQPANHANDVEGIMENGVIHPFQFDEFDIQDAELERAIMEEYRDRVAPAPAPGPARNAEPSPFDRAPENIVPIPGPLVESRVECVDQVVAVFPGICRDYVATLYDSVAQSSDRLIAHILDKVERGSSYPTAKEIERSLKRKREILDEDEEAARKYGDVARVVPEQPVAIKALM